MSLLEHVTLGFPDSPQHEAAAAAVVRVLEAHELEVTLLAGDRSALTGHLQAGRLDLIATAWLPGPDAAWADGAGEAMGGILYRPQTLFAVPAAPGAPASLDDLATDPVARRPLVAAPVEAAARAALSAYGLEQALPVEILEPEPFYTRAAAALAAAEPVLLALWQPHALWHGGRLQALADPKGALGERQEARLVLRAGLRARLDGDLLDELDELTLGNPVVTAMEHAMREGGMSAEEAAEAWQRGKLTPRT